MNTVLQNPSIAIYHELRGPLGLVVTAARCAAEESSEDLVKTRCESIVRAAERMLRTAVQIMDDSRAIPQEGAEFDPVSVMVEVGSDYARLGVPIQLSVASVASIAPVRGDRARLEALLCSLLGNASDHSDPGTPINLVFERMGPRCSISVSNRVGRTEHRGLGLGSLISARLAKEAGVTLRIDRDWQTYAVSIGLELAPLPVSTF